MTQQSNTLPLSDIVNATRNPDEINLVDTIHGYLINAGLIQEADVFLNDPNISTIRNKINLLQRYVLNRYFTIQIYNAELTGVNVNGLEERYMLMPDGTDNEWLSMFRRRVVPFLIANRIPKKIFNM